ICIPNLEVAFSVVVVTQARADVWTGLPVGEAAIVIIGKLGARSQRACKIGSKGMVDSSVNYVSPAVAIVTVNGPVGIKADRLVSRIIGIPEVVTQHAHCRRRQLPSAV